MQVPILTNCLDSPIELGFPPPPIAGNSKLVPIRSWHEMFLETKVTDVEFDNFWFESVAEEVAYFFSWLDQPRATILAIWGNKELAYIECRTLGDVLVEGEALEPILTMVIQAFQQAGYSIQLEPECYFEVDMDVALPDLLN